MKNNHVSFICEVPVELVSSFVNVLTDTISHVLHAAPSPCEKSPGFDVAFVLDRTRSVGRANFKLLKGFIVQIVNALDIGPNATHTAFILFAKNAKILNTFNDSAYHSNEAVQHLIDDTSNWLGRRTFIDRALEAANRTLFTEQGGDRPTFPNVLILLTDGKTNPNSEPYGEIVGNLTVCIKRVSVELITSVAGGFVGERESRAAMP